jgi:PPIC-type peptidyl-prolyl cis-trans isomerase-like protein
VNDLCPRTFEDAERELERFAERCADAEEFAARAERHSEEPGTRKQRGDLGWVTRGDPRVPAPLREALFHWLDTGGVIPEHGRALGPVRLDSGAALLWVSARRASPPWEEMSEHVHEELRRRFIEEVMPLESVELLTGDE